MVKPALKDMVKKEDIQKTWKHGVSGYPQQCFHKSMMFFRMRNEWQVFLTPKSVFENISAIVYEVDWTLVFQRIFHLIGFTATGIRDGVQE